MKNWIGKKGTFIVGDECGGMILIGEVVAVKRKLFGSNLLYIRENKLSLSEYSLVSDNLRVIKLRELLGFHKELNLDIIKTK